MTRPKLLPNEALADLVVSTATNLQCYCVNILICSLSLKKICADVYLKFYVCS